jgi:hypothetical protein
MFVMSEGESGENSYMMRWPSWTALGVGENWSNAENRGTRPLRRTG